MTRPLSSGSGSPLRGCPISRWIALGLLGWLSACTVGAANYPLIPDGHGDVRGQVRLLGAIRLQPRSVDGLKLVGLSGLAWDEDEQLLYAISDHGRLFHLRVHIDNDRLVAAEVVAGYPLTDGDGRALRYPWSDAEGLTLDRGNDGRRGNSELLVSFEHRPRVRVYDMHGRRLRAEPLPAPLEDRHHYADPNRALESITRHPRHGLLVAPERPLRGDDTLRLFDQQGRNWRHALRTAPGSALVALEALPDGRLLALERAFVAPYLPFEISLREVDLIPNDDTARVRDLAVFSTADGWRLDNFEGLTRHRGRRFFMVSDDNDSVWQDTLLVYFEWLPYGGGQ
jgi:hypothetical protein